MRKYEHISVEPVGVPGAEISHVDLCNPLTKEVIGELRRAFADNGVLFFRDQDLTPEQQIQFAGHWGSININRFFTPVPDYPMIAEVRKEAEQQSNIGGSWHTDHTYDEIPALGSILYAREVPDIGGDTLFACMYAAYDALSDGMKNTLRGLKALHSSRHAFGATAHRPVDMTERIGNAELATQDAIHPVVITHPLSGKRALYVNPGFTVKFDGWTREESEPLLNFLYKHASQPEFTYRFHWKNGSMAFWDNRATWHCALNDYHGERRLLHRITLEGEALT